MPCPRPSGRRGQWISARTGVGIDVALVGHVSVMSKRKLSASVTRTGGSLINDMLKGLGHAHGPRSSRSGSVSGTARFTDPIRHSRSARGARGHG